MITEYIDYVLKNKLYDRVIVTGLDHSGKSTTLTPLVGKYNYIKCHRQSSEKVDPISLNCYQLYDRSPITDSHVYHNMDRSIDLDSIHNLIKYYIDKYYPNSLFIFYLHDKFLGEGEPDYVYRYRDVIHRRFTELSRYLINNGYPVITVYQDSIQKWNSIIDH